MRSHYTHHLWWFAVVIYALLASDTLVIIPGFVFIFVFFLSNSFQMLYSRVREMAVCLGFMSSDRYDQNVLLHTLCPFKVHLYSGYACVFVRADAYLWLFIVFFICSWFNVYQSVDVSGMSFSFFSRSREGGRGLWSKCVECAQVTATLLWRWEPQTESTHLSTLPQSSYCVIFLFFFNFK